MKKAEKFLQSWANAVLARNLEKLISLYDSSAVLKPTLSSAIRATQEDIIEYFDGGSKFNDHGFLKNGFKDIKFYNQVFKSNDDVIVCVGDYDFVKADDSIVSAQYTYCLISKGDQLKIFSHHSSLK